MLSAATHFTRAVTSAYVPPASCCGGAIPGAAAPGGSCGWCFLSGLDFDVSGRLIAAAGVQQRVCVFDAAALLAAPPAGGAALAAAAPVVDLPTAHKISAVDFGPDHASRGLLLASDYAGGLLLLDVAAGGGASAARRWDAHAQRAWCAEFAPGSGGAACASGSDDHTVKVWSVQQPRAALTLDAGANVCAVAHHPTAGHTLAVGSADHQVLIYDLRSPRAPLATLRGHGKAVSYVRWLSESELVTSSIDSTVRLWQAGGAAGGGAGGGEGGGEGAAGWACGRVFTGHRNRRNFVGLSAASPFIAVGSEANAVVVYYKGIANPVLTVPLTPPGGAASGGAASGGGGGGSGGPSHFVSAVCWRGGGDWRGGGGGGAPGGGGVLAAANSQGGIWLLSLS
ncbi:MAG: WD40-repeat-containing domain protein [Monoraphidium minutum]|nr:MAG: WD40-repeat-containing domain protein [Monoraphidium minutum]